MKKRSVFSKITSIFLAAAVFFAGPTLNVFAVSILDEGIGDEILQHSSPFPTGSAGNGPSLEEDFEEIKYPEEPADTIDDAVLGMSALITSFSGSMPFNFSSIVMSVDGQPVDPNAALDIQSNTVVRLDYTWTIDDGIQLDISPATYTLTLPSAFKVGVGGISQENLYDSGDPSNAIGTLAVSSNGVVTIVFSDPAFASASSLGRNGSFFFELGFSSQVTEGPGRQEIDLGFGSEQELQLANPGVDSPIDKDAFLDPGFNSKHITWTIDINREYDALNGAALSDPIPQGLTVTGGISGIKVYDLEITLQDPTNPTQGSEITSGFQKTYTNNTVAVSFDQAINTPYRIIIETDIADDAIGTAQFFNTANLTGTYVSNGLSLNVSDSITVTNTSSFGKDITKVGHLDAPSGTITWQVRLNYNKKSIVPYLTDDLSKDINVTNPNGSSFKWAFDESEPTFMFKVEKVTPTSENSESGLTPVDFAYKIDPTTKQSFELSIGSTTLTQAPQATTDSYLITYTTHIDNHATVENSGVVGNTMNIGSLDVYAEVQYGTFNYRAGVYKSAILHPENHTVDWTIQVNDSGWNVDMINAVITDTIPKDHGIYDIDFSSIVVKDSSGSTLQGKMAPGNASAGDRYEITQLTGTPSDNWEEGFKITFISTGTTIHTVGKHTITFKTKYDFVNLPSSADNKFKNHASVDYSGVTDEYDFVGSVIDEIGNQGKKTGHYNIQDKRITWENFINYNNVVLDNTVINDKLGPDQKLHIDTLKIYTVKYSGTTAQKDQELTSGFTVTPIKTADVDTGFTLTFSSQVTQALLITYQSEPTGIITADKEYSNTASLAALRNGQSYEAEWKATQEIPKDGIFVEKNGTIDYTNAILKWRVTINPNQSVIENATLTDTLSIQQQYTPSSFKLYNASYNASGTLEKGALVDTNDFEIKISPQTADKGESFVLKFKGSLTEISSAYILEYDQNIVKPSDGSTNISNSAMMGGGHLPVVPTSEVIAVDWSLGGGTGGWNPIQYHVRVGGIVWVDLNSDGIREDHDPGIGDVTIVLQDQNGDPVVDIYGNTVQPYVTSTMGRFVFNYLPPLKSGESYVALIDYAASKEALEKYEPTLEHIGKETNSSSTDKDSTTLPRLAGQEFMHLDFGFILKKNPPVVNPPVDPIIPPTDPPVVRPPVINPPVVNPPVDPIIPPTDPPVVRPPVIVPPIDKPPVNPPVKPPVNPPVNPPSNSNSLVFNDDNNYGISTLDTTVRAKAAQKNIPEYKPNEKTPYFSDNPLTGGISELYDNHIESSLPIAIIVALAVAGITCLTIAWFKRKNR